MLPDADTIQKAIATLKIVLETTEKRAEGFTAETLRSGDEVIARYQPIFSPEAVGRITEEDFRSFLVPKNNKHWGGLQRLGPRMTEDMDMLREALTVLVDETRPIQQRLDIILPKSGPKVKKLGRAVVTAILLIVYPDKYGPMNNTSVDGAKKLGLMPRFTGNESFGERYAAFNDMLLTISHQLGVDLWTLDMLWYEYLGWNGEEQEPGEAHIDDTEIEITPQARFGLERYLQEFIRDNWEHIVELNDWTLYEEDGEVVGFEYNTGEIGRIDLLARHKTERQWLVIELKRNQSSDETIGQTLRYMGWVSQNLAKNTDEVRGMIICHEGDRRIGYALNYTNNVDLLLYEVEFRLRKG